MMIAFSANHPWLFLSLSIVFIAIVTSNILGILLFIFCLYESICDVTEYFFHYIDWTEIHRHSIIFLEKSDVQILLESDVFSLGIPLLILLHLFLSAKRCKNLGISSWWVLVPLYSPIALIFKKPIVSFKKVILLIVGQIAVMGMVYGGLSMWAKMSKFSNYESTFCYNVFWSNDKERGQ